MHRDSSWNNSWLTRTRCSRSRERFFPKDWINRIDSHKTTNGWFCFLGDISTKLTFTKSMIGRTAELRNCWARLFTSGHSVVKGRCDMDALMLWNESNNDFQIQRWIVAKIEDQTDTAQKFINWCSHQSRHLAKLISIAFGEDDTLHYWPFQQIWFGRGGNWGKEMCDSGQLAAVGYIAVQQTGRSEASQGCQEILDNVGPTRKWSCFGKCRWQQMLINWNTNGHFARLPPFWLIWAV